MPSWRSSPPTIRFFFNRREFESIGILRWKTPFKTFSTASDPRYNEASIQMISKGLHTQLFPKSAKEQSHLKISKEVLELSKKHLKKHNIPFDVPRPAKPEINMKLPKLLGSNIEEHFLRIGEMVGLPWTRLIHQFFNYQNKCHDGHPFNFENFKGNWSKRVGWTRYSLLTGEDLGSVPYPLEQVNVLDVETCVQHGHNPLMAVALSEKFIYSWISPFLFPPEDSASVNEEVNNVSPLITWNNSSENVVIGHHISFDRSKLLPEYSLQLGKTRFLDTLSMHCAIAGLSSQQRALWNKQKEDSANSYIDDEGKRTGDQEEPKEWIEKCSMNSLSDAVALHCQYFMNKEMRNVLIKGSIEDVRNQFQEIMTYCANDVAATHNLFLKLFPKFLEKNPHPITLAASLEMSTCFLPTNESWNDYIQNAEKMYQKSLEEVNELLRKLVVEVMEEGMSIDPSSGRPVWESDPWLSKLDWTPVPARYTKPKYRKDGSFAANGEPRPIGDTYLFGKPLWFKTLYHGVTKLIEITPMTRILPYLLRIKWDGRPVHFLTEDGWCFGIKSTEDSKENSAEKNLKKSDPKYPDWNFYKIPHSEKEGANVGSLMSKKQLKLFEKGILTSDSDVMRQVMKINSMFAFWVGYRERITEQHVEWAGSPGIDLPLNKDKESGGGERVGIILPKTMIMGTVTRRAVEPLWMTASNAKKNMVGSEVKSKIIAPSGYTFIGADVDSQELWISSLLGDAQFGFAGASALGWMTLQGAKSDNTDLHSRTASILGMSRDNAKIFNYGRIYGAGVTFAAQLMQKFNPNISKEEAHKKASLLYKETKGVKREYSKDSSRKYFVGGTETFMFNVLEKIAYSNISKTPALSSRISEALVSSNFENEYLTSRINWAVQSSGVDYLHLLICSMRYLIEKYNINARLSITIHDELRYLVTEEDMYRAALALQIANCWTRSLFAHRVQMSDLPLSVAFFSAVDFDKVLRKEAYTDCVTPSNPTPVPPGFALDIYQLLEKLPDGLGPVSKEYSYSGNNFSSQRSIEPFEFCRESPEFIQFQLGESKKKGKEECSNGQAILEPMNGFQKRIAERIDKEVQ